ncbi:MAG: hypothetical protein ABFE13_09865 [Phycisphaerales bacterium]
MLPDPAQQILSKNRDTLVILSTHRHLYDFRILQGRYGDGVFGQDTFEEAPLADEKYDIETVWPEELFETFIRVNRNILLVLCGHCTGQYYQVESNDWGLPIISVVTDYEDSPNGGDGWLRLMEFDFDNGTVGFSTYSPTLDRERIIIDDFMDTLGIIAAYEDTLAEAIGLTEFQKTVILNQMRADLPGYTKAPELEAYLQRPEVQKYLTSSGMHYAWDGLWKQAFANGQRDPSLTMAVDFDAYVRADAELSP